MRKTGDTLEAVMSAILVLSHEIVAQCPGIFLASRKLTILYREALGIFAHSIINYAFKKRRRQIQHLRQVEGYCLLRERLRPFVGIFLVNLEQLGSVIPHR